jgi:hypothetical protein
MATVDPEPRERRRHGEGAAVLIVAQALAESDTRYTTRLAPTPVA